MKWSLVVVVFVILSVVALAMFTNCASIIHGTKQDVVISSNPSQAQMVIRDKGGVEVYSGNTPATVKLPRKDEYDVIINMAGYQETKVHISKEFDATVLGNLICGGIIGLIVDFANGAAYKLEPGTINVELVTANIEGRKKEIYAVMRVADEEGQLRTLVIPLIIS